jgi:hypothetical protein
VSSDRRLQEACDARPQASGEGCGDDRDQDVQEGRQRVQRRPDPDRRDRADDVLALAADVEEPAPEGKSNGQPREHEHRELDQCLLEVARSQAGIRARVPRKKPVQAGPVEDRPVRGQRVLAADDEHDEPAHDEGEQHGQERDDDAPCPLGEGKAR